MTQRNGKRVVVITGAAQGIGRVISKAFARAGWRVAAADVQKDKVEDVARQLQADGEVRPVVVPDPSCPEPLVPHDHSVPSVRTAIVLPCTAATCAHVVAAPILTGA